MPRPARGEPRSELWVTPGGLVLEGPLRVLTSAGACLVQVGSALVDDALRARFAACVDRHGVLRLPRVRMTCEVIPPDHEDSG